jgi:hypothetical protein
LIDIPPCGICGQHFDNIFEATDHLIEDNGEQEFNPEIILPNGYRLLVGSMLRQLFDNADNPEKVRTITQLTYGTLYAAESDIGLMKKLVEDAIIHEHMSLIDEELEELLEEDR